MPKTHLIMPDLGIDDQQITASVWLAKLGERIDTDEGVLEVLAGAATVDIPAPSDCRIIEKLVGEDEPIEVGQKLAVIAT